MTRREFNQLEGRVPEYQRARLAVFNGTYTLEDLLTIEACETEAGLDDTSLDPWAAALALRELRRLRQVAMKLIQAMQMHTQFDLPQEAVVLLRAVQGKHDGEAER